MSSRFTLNTNILTIRDVFAFNSKTDEVIHRDYFPVIQDDAKITWVSPSTYIQEISCLKTTVGNLLNSIKPGFSTLSTSLTKTTASNLASTVTGLGSSGYVSSATELYTVTLLSSDYSYISSTTLYDSIRSLSKLDHITNYFGPIAMFLAGDFSNFPGGGYVSTIYPGKYKTYYSTLGFIGGLTDATIGPSPIQSVVVDIGGYSSNILQASKMKIDIIGSANIKYTSPPTPESVVTTFSTFLYNGTRPIGTPVVTNYSNANHITPGFTYLLKKSDLTPFPTQLTLRHRISNYDSTAAQITTNIQGIQVRLINKD
jgi:hypothetical protein